METGCHGNRAACRYEVRAKDSNAAKVIDDIVEYINGHHKGRSGIIYCLSKRDTEVCLLVP